jgi:diguanylate cyclase (GGDEF)-like protein
MLRVLVVGEAPGALSGVPELDPEPVDDLDAGLERAAEGGLDVVLVRVDPADPAGRVHAFRDRYPDLGVVAVVPDQATGFRAAEAGASDHLLLDADEETIERSVRYATTIRRLERELHRRQITDELTGLSNARGFEQLATHHLRLSDRSREPVSIVFVRLEEAGDEGPTRIAEAASVLREAVRGSDVLARVGEDVFAVLLTGEVRGAEALVLSRLVEALALHDAKSGEPLPLSVSVGAAGYDPESPTSLEELMAVADRRMREPSAG